MTSTVVDPGTGSHLHLTTGFTYDPLTGNVLGTTDPRGNVTTSLYDANRRKTEDDHHDGGIAAALNAASKTVYDALGRVTDAQVATAFSPLTWLTTRHTTYTPTSKVATVTDADSRTTTTSYDEGDRTLTVADPVGRKLHYRYCAPGDANCAANAVRAEYRGWQSGNSCSQPPPSLQQCYRRLTYTANGQQKTLKDANGNTTTYAYDPFDRLVKTTFPDSTFEQLTLDENANVTARRTRAGQTLTYAYDDLDQLREKVSPSPAVTTDWTYLLDGRIDTICTTATCGIAGDVIDTNYDTAGRLKQVRTKIPGLTIKVTNYELDANGNRTKLAWPDGYYVGYCYDSLNRMTGAMENTTVATDPACATNLLATYSYDSQSRRTNLAYAGTAGASMAYTYSDAGDLLTLNHVTAGGPSYTFAYTNAHQLQTETLNNANFVWQPPATGTTSYGAANTLNQYPTVAGVPQSYDANGNLTGDGTYSFTYDAENRLLTASKTGLAATYQYDPLGRRTRKSGTGVTDTIYLSDGTDEIAEYDRVTGAITTRYIPGPAIDQTIAMVDASGAKSFFHTNRQGSLVAATDTTNTRTEGPYTYDPYGNCFRSALPCATLATTIPYKYTGRRLDPETGLYYYRARYYDPKTGRFLQVDPIGYDVDPNLYPYAGNDPANALDPYGLLQLYQYYSANAGFVLGGEGGVGYALDVDKLIQNQTISVYKFYVGGAAGGIGEGEGGFGGLTIGAGFFIGSKSDFHGTFINVAGSGKVSGYGVSGEVGFPPNHLFDYNYANVFGGSGPGVASLTGSTTYTWFGDEQNFDVTKFISAADSALNLLSHMIGLSTDAKKAIVGAKDKISKTRRILNDIKAREQIQAQMNACNNSSDHCRAGSFGGVWGSGGPF